MLKARRSTGLVFFPAFDWAISPTHPEREERLLYTQDQVFEEGILDIDGIHEFKPQLANRQDIERVHFCVPDVGEVTTESHFISAGGAQATGNAVLEGRVACGFALVPFLGLRAVATDEIRRLHVGPVQVPIAILAVVLALLLLVGLAR